MAMEVLGRMMEFCRTSSDKRAFVSLNIRSDLLEPLIAPIHVAKADEAYSLVVKAVDDRIGRALGLDKNLPNPLESVNSTTLGLARN
jgi:hypothetical protein